MRARICPVPGRKCHPVALDIADQLDAHSRTRGKRRPATAHERLVAALAAPALPMTISRAVSAQRRCSTTTGWATTASGSFSGGGTNFAGVRTGAGGLTEGAAGNGKGVGAALVGTLGGDGGGSRAGDGSGVGGVTDGGAGAGGSGFGAGSGFGGASAGGGAGTGNGSGGGAGAGNGSGSGGTGTGASGPPNGRAGAGNSKPPRGGTGTGSAGPSYERSGTGISGTSKRGTTGFSNVLVGVTISGRMRRSPWPGSRGSANGSTAPGPSGSSNRGTDRGASFGATCPVVMPGCTRGVPGGSAGAVVDGPPGTANPPGTAPTDPGTNRPAPASRVAQKPIRTGLFMSVAPALRRTPPG